MCTFTITPSSDSRLALTVWLTQEMDFAVRGAMLRLEKKLWKLSRGAPVEFWDFVSVAFSSSCNECLSSHSVMAFIFTHYPSKCWIQRVCIVLAHAQCVKRKLSLLEQPCHTVHAWQCFRILLFSDWLPWSYSPFIWFFYRVCIGAPPLATADVW